MGGAGCCQGNEGTKRCVAHALRKQHRNKRCVRLHAVLRRPIGKRRRLQSGAELKTEMSSRILSDFRIYSYKL